MMISNREYSLSSAVSSERIDLMERGLKELRKWIYDLISNGISTLVQGADEPWESLAVRMVDFKLGGIAGYLRKMINRDDKQLIEEWYFEVVKLIAYLDALITSFQKALNEGKIPSIDILRACGVTFKKEDVKKVQNSISDCWRVLHIETDSNEFIEYSKLYLWGRKTNRLALVLDFKGRDSRGELPWYLIRQDVQFEADLFFYPSAFPVRGFLENIKPIDFVAVTPINKSSNVDFLTAFAVQPFAFSFPVLLNNCQIHALNSGNICWENLQLPCQINEEATESLTGDYLKNPFGIFAEWTGWQLNILRVFTD